MGDLITLHRADLEEVGKKIGRSKDASLNFLDERLGHLRIGELDRERLIKFGKERAAGGAGPETVAGASKSKGDWQGMYGFVYSARQPYAGLTCDGSRHFIRHAP